MVEAMILRRGLRPSAVHARVRDPRGLSGATDPESRRRPDAGRAAAAYRGPPDAGTAHRAARKHLPPLARYRRWLTNANDLPVAALHASRDESVEALTADVERAYESLRTAGYWRGNSLQLVSHLLAADPGHRGERAAVPLHRQTDEGCRRTCLAEPLRQDRGLALTQAPSAAVVDRMLRYRDHLRDARPRPSRDVAFSLAAGIELAAYTERFDSRGVGDAAVW